MGSGQALSEVGQGREFGGRDMVDAKVWYGLRKMVLRKEWPTKSKEWRHREWYKAGQLPD
jgi:hypothetical protein